MKKNIIFFTLIFILFSTNANAVVARFFKYDRNGNQVTSAVSPLGVFLPESINAIGDNRYIVGSYDSSGFGTVNVDLLYWLSGGAPIIVKNLFSASGSVAKTMFDGKHIYLLWIPTVGGTAKLRKMDLNGNTIWENGSSTRYRGIKWMKIWNSENGAFDYGREHFLCNRTNSQIHSVVIQNATTKLIGTPVTLYSSPLDVTTDGYRIYAVNGGTSITVFDKNTHSIRTISLGGTISDADGIDFDGKHFVVVDGT